MSNPAPASLAYQRVLASIFRLKKTLPAGASLNPSTGAFTWTPASGQAGSYQLLFTVTDDGSPAASDSEAITITVNAPVSVAVSLSGVWCI